MRSRQFIGIRYCTWVWLIMLGLTVLTYLIGQLGLDSLHASLLVLGFALIKGQMVGDFFMGLSSLKGFWRWPVSLWLFLPGIMITVAFALVS